MVGVGTINMKTPEPDALPRTDAGPAPSTAWWLLSSLLLLGAVLPLAAGGLQSTWSLVLDWQPALVRAQPWRWWTPISVHYSTLHLGANLVGLALVALLGVVGGLPARAALAWFAAWPLTHLGLALRPELLHYGGLSGVLHAGVAVAGVWLVWRRQGLPQWVGLLMVLALVAKVLSEAPWGPVLQHPQGWDIAVAPWAHATGATAGLLCGTLASLQPAYRTRLI